MESLIKLSEFLWQYVSLWYDVEVFLTIDFLHLYNIVTKTILPSKFIRLRKVIDSLLFSESIINAQRWRNTGPQCIPCIG
jgi:hypothetical protein